MDEKNNANYNGADTHPWATKREIFFVWRKICVEEGNRAPKKPKDVKCKNTNQKIINWQKIKCWKLSSWYIVSFVIHLPSFTFT